MVTVMMKADELLFVFCVLLAPLDDPSHHPQFQFYAGVNADRMHFLCKVKQEHTAKAVAHTHTHARTSTHQFTEWALRNRWRPRTRKGRNKQRLTLEGKGVREYTQIKLLQLSRQSDKILINRTVAQYCTANTSLPRIKFSRLILQFAIRFFNPAWIAVAWRLYMYDWHMHIICRLYAQCAWMTDTQKSVNHL